MHAPRCICASVAALQVKVASLTAPQEDHSDELEESAPSQPQPSPPPPSQWIKWRANFAIELYDMMDHPKMADVSAAKE
jgi:hypothetical protein